MFFHVIFDQLFLINCNRSNIYRLFSFRSATLPCSARLPDTSGVSEPDITDGLKACNDPTCHLQSTKQ